MLQRRVTVEWFERVLRLLLFLSDILCMFLDPFGVPLFTPCVSRRTHLKHFRHHGEAFFKAFPPSQ